MQTSLPLHYSQNFLHSFKLVKFLVRESGIEVGDTVLEIGPGRGIITAALARQVGESGKVLAVELDEKLATNLQEKMREYPQVEIIQQSILDYDLSPLPTEYKVFSNIPFNLTAPILEKVMMGTHSPKEAYLILQSDTLLSKSDGPTFKSLLIYPFYEISVAHHFVRSDFAPIPSVNISLFRLVKRSKPLLQASKLPLYKDFIAYVSKDRIGEGNWKRIFRPDELAFLGESQLVLHKGVSFQSAAGMFAAFERFTQLPANVQQRVAGAFEALRLEQAKREQKNLLGSHHPSKKRPR